MKAEQEKALEEIKNKHKEEIGVHIDEKEKIKLEVETNKRQQ